MHLLFCSVIFTSYCLIKLENQHNKNYMIEVNDLFYAYPSDKQALLNILNFETTKFKCLDFRSIRSWKKHKTENYLQVSECI